MASPYYNPNYRQPTNPYLVGQNNMSLGVAPTTTTGTNTGLFNMFSPSNPSFGSNIGGAGQLLGGIGGLYSAFTAKDYYDQTSDILDQQMGLYEQELDRRNKTRESYSTAFSQGA
jgi:hypothetical protein